MLRPHRHSANSAQMVYSPTYRHQPPYFPPGSENQQHAPAGYYAQPVLMQNVFQTPPPHTPASARDIKSRHDVNSGVTAATYPPTMRPPMVSAPAGYHHAATASGAPPRMSQISNVSGQLSRASTSTVQVMSVSAAGVYQQQQQQQQPPPSVVAATQQPPPSLPQTNLHLPPPPSAGQPPPHSYTGVPPAVSQNTPLFMLLTGPPGTHVGAAGIPSNSYQTVGANYAAHYNGPYVAPSAGLYHGNAGAVWHPSAVQSSHRPANHQHRLQSNKGSHRLAIVNPDTGAEVVLPSDPATTTTSSSAVSTSQSSSVNNNDNSDSAVNDANQQYNSAENVEVRQEFAERVSRLAASTSSCTAARDKMAAAAILSSQQNGDDESASDNITTNDDNKDDDSERSASLQQQKQPVSTVEKRTGGKHKIRELGRRAEVRQTGGDMDAFIDNSSTQEETKPSSDDGVEKKTETVAEVKQEEVSSKTSDESSPVDNVVSHKTVIKTENVTTDKTEDHTVSTVTTPSAVEDTAEQLEDGEIVDECDDSTTVQNDGAVSETSRDIQTPPPQTEQERLIAAIKAIGGSKKYYSREELELLERHPLSHERPLRLPDLPNVVRRVALDVHQKLHCMKSRNSMTGVVDASRSHGKSFRGGRGSQHARRDLGMIQPQLLQQPAVANRRVEISLNRDGKLQSSENAWKAGHRGSKQLDDTTLLIKTLTGHLNKITPSNVDKLVDEIKELKINSHEQLKKVIDVLFVKAVDEPSYAELYAKVCMGIYKTEVTEVEDDKEVKISLRKVLLTKCQYEFERDKSQELNKEERLAEISAITDEKERKLRKLELQEEARKIRLRSNGNIRFIGELYKLDMLTGRIMQQCIAKLILDDHEDSYECLCKLVTTIGSKLEKSEIQQGRGLDQQFNDIKRLSISSKVSSRVRFMMEDLIELRTNKWVSKRVGDIAKPMTIQQVHEEARQEEVNMRNRLAIVEDRRHVSGRSSMGSDRHRGNTGGRSATAGSMSMAGGWSTTPSRNFDSSRLMAVTNRSSSGTMPKMAKPGGDWSHGSMGSGSAASRAHALDLRSGMTTMSSSNRFDALRIDSGDSTTPSSNTATASHKPAGGRPSSLRASSSLSSATNGTKPPSSSARPSTPLSTCTAKPQLRGPATLDSRVMFNKVRSMIGELVQNGDIEISVEECINELHESTVVMFIDQCVHGLIDVSDAKLRHMAGELHHQLIYRQIITTQHYLSAIGDTIPVLIDLVCDIPSIWTNMAELVAPVLLPGTSSQPLQSASISLTSLAARVGPALLEARCSHDLTRALFRRVLELRGAAVLKTIVTAEFDWSVLLGADADVNNILKQWNMVYLIRGEPVPLSLECAPDWPRTRRIITGISQLDSSDNSVSDWLISADVMPSNNKDISEQTSLAVDVLSALCFNCILANNDTDNYAVNCELLEKYSSLMKTVISTVDESSSSSSHVEVSALNALTALVSHLKHPPNLLDRLFRGLYDNDVISECAFISWRDDSAVSVEGKGSAVASVRRFFDQLQED